MKYLLVIFLFCSCTFKQVANPKNIQAKVIGVLDRGRGYVFAECRSRADDCIQVKYYGHNAKLVVVGTWLTIYGSHDDKRGEWVTSGIRINQ